MAIFANVARKTRMNALKMARPSKHKSVYVRKVRQIVKKAAEKYKAPQTYRHEESRLSQYDRGTPTKPTPPVTQTRGGNPQTDWMRWRQPENAILDMLTPEARKQVLGAGLKINIVGPTEQAQYSPFAKAMDIRSGMGADDIRHELTHAGLALTPKLFPDVGIKYKFASSPLGGALGALNTRFFTQQAKQSLAESAAITMGGQEAYPGYTPAFEPEQFSNFFNVQDASWQYATQPEWKIGKK